MRDNNYTVGLVDGTGERHVFATEDEAADFISTLPAHEDGRYYLDGPPDECTKSQQKGGETDD